MKRTLIILALLASGPAMGQSALTPQWDVKAQHDRQEADGATSAAIKRFQDAPWVAQTITGPVISNGVTITNSGMTINCPPGREIVMRSGGHHGCAADVQEPK
jgi:hypothetical protein